MSVRLPSACLVVLVGPSGSGKSTWAEAEFRPDQIVSADRIRALVGEGEHDQRAGRDAFDVLDLVLERRLRRGLLTVLDTLGLDPARRQGYRDLTRRHGLACYAVAFDTSAAVCRARNRERARPVPAKVLGGQLKAWDAARASLPDEGFDAVLEPGPATVVPRQMLTAPALAHTQREGPMPLEFGLHLPSFTWPGGPPQLRERLTAVARCAEEAGFMSIWVMDHLLQIPQVGREWDEMLEAYTTLGYLAAVTQTCRIGTLVTGITYRNVALVGKLVATLDVLSGGRAACGLGAAWFEREHRVYGYDFPPAPERLDLLEDALRLLPLLWGPGAPAFRGHLVEVGEAICYPRPLQEHIPLLVGGSGERRTLRLAARYADACNLFGDVERVRAKVAVLAGHCRDVGRDPATIAVTHLSTTLTAPSTAALDAKVERLRPRNASPESYAETVNAGTVDDQVGRFRGLAEAGVQTAMVSLPDLGDTAPIEEFAPVVAAFRATPAR